MSKKKDTAPNTTNPMEEWFGTPESRSRLYKNFTNSTKSKRKVRKANRERKKQGADRSTAQGRTNWSFRKKGK